MTTFVVKSSQRMDEYVIGLDFGTDSVRAVVVNIETGKEEASAVAYYPRWAEGKYCVPGRTVSQHPLVMLRAWKRRLRAWRSTDKRWAKVRDRIDTTGSAPCAVDQNGLPAATVSVEQAACLSLKDRRRLEKSGEINYNQT